MKIGQVLNEIANLPYLTLSGDSALTKAAEQITTAQQIRGIYVVDEHGRLEGTLSLGVLIRSVMAARSKPHSYARSLLAHITSERVEDIMERHVIHAEPNDEVETVLDRMLTHNIKEIPVLDSERRIVANVGILDLWRLIQK
jgi:CBS domain-containing protein